MAARSPKTLEQLARLWGRSLEELGTVLREVAPQVTPKRARHPQTQVSPADQDKIMKRLGIVREVTPPPPPEAPPEGPLVYDPRTLAPPQPGDFPVLSHPLWLADGVLEAAERHGLARRLHIILQHLAAGGDTSQVKGCKGQENGGWLRTPLGGNGGRQYYLWWTMAGHPPVKRLALPKSAVVVQAVRHHDDHDPLTVGAPGDYHVIRRAPDLDVVEAPWTAEQLAFSGAAEPVRVLAGRPGTGKTTVLWRAIEAEAHARVLYVTWSPALVSEARQRMAAFAPKGVYVEARDFTSLLGELSGQDVPTRPLAECRSAFIERLLPQGAALGDWARRPAALFAEARAHLFGRAQPEDWVTSGGLRRLSDEAYLAERRGLLGSLADRTLRVVASLERAGAMAGLFPELAAAAAATERLRRGELAVGMAAFDRVVVDEVQDLTLLEVRVLIELCRAIADAVGRPPELVVAGDEGQTVRPSGFEWGRLNALVGRLVARPMGHALHANLRCPPQIAAVIERAGTYYGHLEKGARPAKHGPVESPPADPQATRRAGCIHRPVATAAEAIEILRSLDALERLVVVTATDERPPWLPPELDDLVVSPAEAKGLEYQHVVVVNPGEALLRLASVDVRQPAEEHARRTTLDQLRVAISRATEHLILLDVEAPEAALRTSRALLGPDAVEEDDLPAYLEDAEASAEERVHSRLQEVPGLRETRPRRAWQRAHQAVVLLGEPGQPGAVVHPDLRRQAAQALATTAAHLRVRGRPPGLATAEVDAAALGALARLAEPGQADAYRALAAWADQPDEPPMGLLAAVAGLGAGGRWLVEALAPARQTLRRALEAAADNSLICHAFSGDVAGWLAATAWPGDPRDHAEVLRRRAFEALLAADRLPEAEGVLDRFTATDARCRARLRLAQGRPEEAAALLEALGDQAAARQAWRAAGRWERALALTPADSPDAADLAWLVRVTACLAERPEDLAARLTPAEASRLAALGAALVADTGRGGASQVSGTTQVLPT